MVVMVVKTSLMDYLKSFTLFLENVLHITAYTIHTVHLNIPGSFRGVHTLYPPTHFTL